jgi:hypothetical protein
MKRIQLPLNCGYKQFFVLIFFLVSGCKKESKIPCKDDFRIDAPIIVNYKLSRMTINDTLRFSIEIPMKNLNGYTGDSMDLSLFNDLWGGFTILEFITDSIVVPGGGPINSIPARVAFTYSTKTNQFEIPNDAGRPAPDALFFRYYKAQKSFSLSLSIIPKKKGTFTFNFLSGGFRDAECFNKVNHEIIGYRNDDYTKLLEEAIGKPLRIDANPYNPFLYIIRVE